MPNLVKYKGKYSHNIHILRHVGIQSLNWAELASLHFTLHSACSKTRLPFLKPPK